MTSRELLHGKLELRKAPVAVEETVLDALRGLYPQWDWHQGDKPYKYSGTLGGFLLTVNEGYMQSNVCVVLHLPSLGTREGTQINTFGVGLVEQIARVFDVLKLAHAAQEVLS